MKRFLFPALLGVFLFFPQFANAQTNQVSLTTYYPAPFGAYDRLRLVPRDHLGGNTNTCTAAEEGTLYIDRQNNNVINQCKPPNWVPIAGGVWDNEINAVTLAGTSIDYYYPSEEYNSIKTNRPFVGIGTREPKGTLHLVSTSDMADGSASIIPDMLILENEELNGWGANIAFIEPNSHTTGKTNSLVARIRGAYPDNPPPGTPSMLSEINFSLRDGSVANNNLLVDIFTFSGNGRLGIQENTPDALLEVSGDGAVGVPYFMLSSDDDTNGDVLIVNDTGNVGINKQNPTERLEVVGKIKATTLILTSDASLKQEILPVTGALDKISRLNGVSFEWKDNPEDHRKHMGVIAQDVEKIFPEVVYGQDGAKGVDYPSLIAPLIEAVKELKTQNETLGRQLQDQNAQIIQQQTTIESLQRSLAPQKPNLAP